MAINRRAPVKPERLPSYPHFGREDAEVWDQWLFNNQSDIVEVYYDIALGGVMIDDPDLDQAYKDAWQYDTAVKIDAVAVFNDHNLVIEVKPYPRMGAIGQALGYTMLLNADPLNDLPSTPCVVCYDTTEEVQRVADALGILIETVKAPPRKPSDRPPLVSLLPTEPKP